MGGFNKNLMNESVPLNNLSLEVSELKASLAQCQISDFKSLPELAVLYSIGLACLLIVETIMLEKQIDEMTENLENYSNFILH